MNHREWCLGSEGFRQELLAQVNELAGPEHRGEDIRQSAQQKAQGIVQAELGKPRSLCVLVGEELVTAPAVSALSAFAWLMPKA